MSASLVEGMGGKKQTWVQSLEQFSTQMYIETSQYVYSNNTLILHMGFWKQIKPFGKTLRLIHFLSLWCHKMIHFEWFFSCTTNCSVNFSSNALASSHRIKRILIGLIYCWYSDIYLFYGHEPLSSLKTVLYMYVHIDVP